MEPRSIVVLDVGKTISKVTLVAVDGRVLARVERPNHPQEVDGLLRLDAHGIERWLAGALAALPGRESIGWIVPVAHGAAAALVGPEGLRALPLDYEQSLPDNVGAAYDSGRDAFAFTGSPRLANGLNLGAQLHFLEGRDFSLLDPATTILLWPQYWAHLLCGVSASEVSSLGCHSDLWRPTEGRPSTLSLERGWADRLPPLRHAAEVLGRLRPAWAVRTGLPTDVRVLCGVHDSNAALLAARGFPEIAGREATVLSTGTWFVAMRNPASPIGLDSLACDRDCLANVDVDGRSIPSARFMGGRELQLLVDAELGAIDAPDLQERLIKAASAVVSARVLVVPPVVPGSGPFPAGAMARRERPDDPVHRAAAAVLYGALMTDVVLGLIGTRERLVVEGRFSRVPLLVRAIAALRPDLEIFIAPAGLDLVYGACRLVRPDMAPPSALERVDPLALDLTEYRRVWQGRAGHGQVVA